MKKWILALALLFSLSAQAGYETGAADQVLVVPHAGGRPKYGQLDLSQAAAVKNQLPVAKGGTGQDLSAATGMVKVTAGSVSALTAAQSRAFTNVAPTVQKFLSTGTQTGWVFTISTSSTVAVGDTYTNNSNTYTVQGALTAQSGQVLWMSGTGATSGTTLTRATGSGTSSITFSTKVATATYTTPTSPAPLYIAVRAIGGGGGGGAGSNSGTFGAGGNGGATLFGPNLLVANGGLGGDSSAAGGGSLPVAGGTASVAASSTVIQRVANQGAGGGTGWQELVVTYSLGGPGASTPFGGGGPPGNGNAATILSGIANTGAGGGGGGAGSNGNSGGGGSAGGYLEAIITGASLVASFPYAVGPGGAGGVGSFNGAPGGSGFEEVVEYYQ